MHDLNTINRLNAECLASSIHRFRANGRFVLARYTGLTLVSIKTFSNVVEATQAHEVAVRGKTPDERLVLYAPLPAWMQAQHDQSEDRATQQLPPEELARLGRGDITLGDYIARKSY